MALDVILEPLADKVAITAYVGSGDHVDCAVDTVKVRPSHGVGGYQLVGLLYAVKVVSMDHISSVRYHDGKEWTEVRTGTITSEAGPFELKIDAGAD